MTTTSALFDVFEGESSGSSAVLSPDGRYRYALRRSWGHGPTALWIMLNPSTADAANDDPTIRRCVSFSKREGCGSLVVVNLYALRATQPSVLLTDPDPCGPDNWMHVSAWLKSPHVSVIIAAWGSWQGQRSVTKNPPDVFRGQDGPLANRGVKCLGLTKAGYPRHPLYVTADTPLTGWPA